jgi:Ca2+-binding RTX toxin-like protein
VATYQFSALADGQAVSFNPNVDRLNFDQSAIAAGDIRVTAVGSNLLVTYLTTGKEVTLLNTAVNQLASTNFTLTNASLARFGDNSAATTNDAGANTLAGGDGRDLLMGLGGNDTLGGGAGSDVLIGGSGNDSIGGGSNGDDWLEGGAGVDRLAGGSGKDDFVFREAGTANADTVTDFVTNWDRIQLDGNTLSGLGANGRFASGDVRFHSGAGVTTAHDADDRIIYNTTTGQVFYDADGAGGASAQLVANLGAGRALTASDFNVFNVPASAGETINGTDGDDTLIGTTSDDVINGLGGDDWLEGNEGDDVVNGGTGNDVILGDSGSGPGDDTLLGGDGNDFFDFWAISGNDSVDGGAGVDVINLSESEVAVTVDFTAGTVSGAGGSMVVANVERAYGGNGNDLLRAGAAAVDFSGSSGNDTLIGSSGNDYLHGDANFSLDDGIGRIGPFAGGADSIVGGAGDDTIIGYREADTLEGGAGNDLFVLNGDLHDEGNYGDDLINGGTGSDTVGIVPGDALVVDLGAGTLTDGVLDETANATLISIENFVVLTTFEFSNAEGAFNDRITGSSAANRLDGSFGNDTIDGVGGNDTLIGGDGADHYLFTVAPDAANADQVTDFTSGSDKIVLSSGVHANLGPSGNFTAGDARFAANTTGTAQDTSDRVIHNTATGELWYDADGNGAGARQLIATIQNGRAVAATDIVADGLAPAPIVGTEGSDTLRGTDGDDTIDGLGGNDSAVGGTGADQLIGGAGNDTLDGLIESAAGGSETVADTMDGGLGDDRYLVDFAGDVLSDTGGMDTVVTRGIDWTLASAFENLVLGTNGQQQTGIGNALNNSMRLGFDGGRLEGLGGDDTLTAEGGLVATLLGGDGNDSLRGGFQNDTLDGGAGNDTFRPGGMFDSLTGGGGADTFIFDSRFVEESLTGSSFDTISDFASGVDRIHLDVDDAFLSGVGPSGTLASNDPRFHAAAGATGGHDADDRLVYDTASGRLYFDTDGSGANAAEVILVLNSGAGAATLAATDITVIDGAPPPPPPPPPSGALINGTAGNDTLTGTSGNDTINGLGGNDLFVAGSTGGADVFDGGAGSDSIEFRERATSAVVVDFGSGTITGGSSGSINFTSIERVVGSNNFNDSLTGNATAQNLTGQGGADTLVGAGGLDTLWGGGGNDTFIFRDMGTANADRVSDFTSGGDKLHLDDSAFTAIGAMGNFAAGDVRFWAAAGATTGHDANDRVVYNTSTGQLYYDADGSGAAAAQLVATLTALPAIAATDIAVI